MSEMQYAMMPYEHYEEAVNAAKDLIGDDTPFQSHELAPKLRSVKAAQPIHNCDYLFQNGFRLDEIDKLDLSEVTSAEYLFKGAKNLTELPEGLDLSRVTSLKSAFNGCTGLKTTLELDVPNCENLQYAFADNAGMPKIVFKTPTSKVTDFNYMCSQKRNQTIIEGLDTRNGINFVDCFRDAIFNNQKLVLDLSNATNFSGLLYGTKVASGVEITFSENTKGATQTSFNDAYSNLSKFEAKGIIAISLWFSTCKNLTAESAISIINCLKDFSGTDKEFTTTLSFNQNTITALESLGATSPNGNTWLEYIGDKGWLYA